LDDVLSNISSNKKYEAITDGTNTIVTIPKDPSKPIIVEHAYEDEKSFSINMPSDITAWEITKCVGATSWAIGSGVFGAAKLLKVKKYIAALGGIRTAASLLISATTAAERLEAGGTALLNLASLILGIDEIKEDCDF